MPVAPPSPETSPETRPGSRHRGRLKRLLLGLALVAGLACLAAWGMHARVLAAADGRVFGLRDAPERQVILVLGASVRPGGVPSPMLSERLRCAAELYATGLGRRILVSGDGKGPDYDEVAVMARVLEENGVPRDRIMRDPAGYRTLDSMYRAKEVYGVETALVVSNPFHLPRAIFLGRQAGMDVVGVAADYDVAYSRSTMLWHGSREVLARLLAWADVYVLDTQPQARERGD